VWERVAHGLIAHHRRLPHARQRQVPLDSTSGRVHQQGTGAQATGRSRGRDQAPPAAPAAAPLRPVAYAQRHHIEQTINKLKHFRRLATRYDKLDRSYNAFIALRITSLYLN
jgi:transposase